MSNDSTSIVSKVWNYAHVLKNAGVGYGDYVEQITYLLFLKLADEMTELGFDNPIPKPFAWSKLSSHRRQPKRNALVYNEIKASKSCFFP
jgi:type I restriction enzyme M protein